MARVTWPLSHGRPAIEVDLLVPGSDQRHRRLLLADTGAGPNDAPFELLLNEDDCVLAAQRVGHFVRLGGAYSGEHRTYVIEVRVLALEFSRVAIVGASNIPRRTSMALRHSDS